MPPQVAFYLSTAVIIWLSTKDKQHRKSIGSAATWIPLVWLFVLGSRPLSAWPISSSLGISAPQLNAEGYLEGSPFDKLLFFGLIAAGLVVVAKRPYSWRAIIQNNRNLFIFIIYLGVSTLWSEFPFVAFKRWFKDLGNVVMVLVILSEENPLEALKTVLMRFAWMSIIYSVICIKYYPD